MTVTDSTPLPLAGRASERRDDVLGKAVDEAARLVDARGALIFLRGDEADGGGLRLSSGVDAREVDIRRWEAALRGSDHDGILVRAMTGGRTMITDDYAADSAYHLERAELRAVRGFGVRSIVATPLVVDGETVGVLGVYSDRPAAFSERDVAILTTIAEHAAGTVANVRLIDQLERSRAEIARGATALRGLHEIVARFATITDPVALLQHVVDEANRLVAGDGAVLDTLDPASGILAWAYDSGLSSRFGPEQIADYTLPIGVGLTGRAVAERRVLVVGDDLVNEFPLSAESDRFFEVTGFRSMIAAPIAGESGPLGALEVYSTRPDAFDAAHGALVGALADHAAVALTNARLIEALDRSRGEIARRAEAEHALREIAARLTAIHEPGTIIQQTVDEAARLLRADGARIDLIDPALRLLRGAYMSGGVPPTEEEWPDTPDETLDTGVSGLAVAEARTFFTGDYLGDDRFRHGSGSDTYVRNRGIHAVMAAPLVGEDGPFGALTVFAARPDAFDEAGAELLEAVASQAAIAITNARLIEALDRSAREVARRAAAEHTLHEIGARISAIHAPDEVIQQAVDEAVRLLAADQARVELVDLGMDQLRAVYVSSADAATPEDERARAGRPSTSGVAGRVIADGRPFFTGDYLADDRFEHDPGQDEYVGRIGLRSVLCVPLVGENGPIGVLAAGSRRPDAFDDGDAAVLDGLASHVSVAFATARLIEALDRSRGEIARRAETERALREIAARITAVHDPADILEQVATETGRLLGADGATIDLFSPIGTSFGFWSGLGAPAESAPTTLYDIDATRGIGISGLALDEDRPMATGDYLADERFTHEAARDEFIRAHGIQSVAAAPLRTEDGPVGVINVHAVRPDAFGPDELRIVGVIADMATVAVTNARLMERLNRSAEELARRADVERALREIAVRLTGIRDPAEVLQLTVDEAVRILRADGAILDLLDRGRGVLTGAYESGMTGRVERDRSRDQELAVGRGVSGRAVEERTVVVTGDYLHDDRFIHDPAADEFITQAKIRSMIAAPLIGETGPVGVLEVYSERRDAFGPGSVALIEAFAGQATVAIENARLNARLEASEAQYRVLVTSSPDLIWAADPEGRFTFISETAHDMLGWEPKELVGHHFSEVVAPSSMGIAAERWQRVIDDPTARQFVPLDLVRRDGTIIPTEITAIGVVADGRLVGVHGSTRDVRERERLERELRRQSAEIAASEERAHLARELHDSVTQALFSMTLITRSIELLLERDPAQAAERLGDLRELQRDALAEMRALIFELRPGSLERDGLVEALRTHAAAVEGRTGLSIVVDAPDLADRLPLDLEDTLYRVGQEALHNVVKHASSKATRVIVTTTDGWATMTVEDDGVGFDPTAVGEGHLGIEGMRARVQRAGGHLEVDSAPGRGTRVRTRLPLARS